MFNVNVIRKDFPILDQKVNDRPLVYFDNSATTQLPDTVLEIMVKQLHTCEANVHRGIHTLSEKSTANMENAREQLRKFLGAEHVEEIIFTSGATDSINRIARCLGFGMIKSGDEIITTQMEHHSNLIPWQELCKRTGATLKVIPVDSLGNLDIEIFEQTISENTRLVAVTWVSNVTGAVNPIETIIKKAHEKGALVLIDGAQAIRHTVIDLKKLDCDFFVMSGHKMMGPTGTGVMYGKREILEKLSPDSFGGGMVDEVFDYNATYGVLPHIFEAGTPNIVGNIGLGASAEYLFSIGMEDIIAQENLVLNYIVKELKEREGIRLVGDPGERFGCVSFNINDLHCYDTAKLFDQLGIAVRSGHHCANPLLRAFGETGAVRVSPAFYNTLEEAQFFVDSLDRILKVGKGRS